MPHGTKLGIPSGAGILAAERAGTGRPLVCLHAGVADRRMFAGQMTGLSEYFDVAAYDRRGYGQTQTPDEPFSHLDDLAEFLTAVGAKAPILLGCSQGGRISIDLALAYPDRVSALILIGTAISGERREPVPDYAKVLEAALEAAEEAEDIDLINALEAQIWLDGPTSAEGRVTGPIRDLFLDMNRIALEHPELKHRRDPPSAFGRLSEINVPVLLVHGTLDFHYIIDRHAHLAKVLPDADTVVCEGVAHLPPMEVPDLVNDRILGFCRERGFVS